MRSVCSVSLADNNIGDNVLTNDIGVAQNKAAYGIISVKRRHLRISSSGIISYQWRK